MEKSLLALELLKNLTFILFGAIGSFVALAGLRTWKIQLKGKTDYELAKRMLSNIYSLRQRIGWFRNPIMLSDEIYSATKEAKISEKEYDIKYDAVFVFQKRWNKIVEVYNELNVAKIESEVVWDKGVSLEIDKIRSLLTELKNSLDEMLDLERKENLSDKLYGYLVGYKKIVYDRSTKDKPDDFTKKLNAVFESLEDLIKPYLK